MDRTSGYLYPELETAEWDETLAGFDERLTHLIDHAWEHSPAIKERFLSVGAEPGDIRTVSDLEKLPVMPKSAMVELQAKNPPYGGLLAVPITDIAHICRSPGPIWDPKGRGEGWGWEEGLYATGFRPGDISINTFAYHLTPAGMMFDDGLRKLGCPVVPTGVGEKELQLEIMRALGVSGYVGMASFLLQIGEKAISMGLDPKKDLNLRAAFSTAEPMPDSLRGKVEDMFGLILRQGFGTAECGLLAYECYHKGGMHLSTRAIVEIVDPQTGKQLPMGEVGEMVVTLFDRTYILIRLGTGDLSAIDPVDCDCGRKSPKLRGWLGRADQLVKVKGQFVHPGQVVKTMAAFAEISKYRLVVTRLNERDTLTLKAEAPESVQGLSEAIKKGLREGVRLGCEVELVGPGTLPDDGKVLEDARIWD